MLYREPKLLKDSKAAGADYPAGVSVLYREPKLLKERHQRSAPRCDLPVSVLYREPKLLKGTNPSTRDRNASSFQCSTVSRNC